MTKTVKKSAKVLSFKEWLRKTGTKTVAKKLRVTEATPRFWLKGHTLPSPRLMRHVIKMADGQLTYGRIIEDHFSKNNKNRWDLRK